MQEGYTEVFAWGGDHFGQLGLGGKVLNKTYSSPRFCSFNILIKEISCGEEHSGFISSSGHVYTMGSNTDGRLGIGSRTIRNSASPCLVEDLANTSSLKISCGWAHTAIITEAGELFTWGLGEYGALGTGNTESRFSPSLVQVSKGLCVDISCGSRSTGIIVKDKTFRKSLYMCGSGEAGQLGTGRREKELNPVLIDLPEEIEQVSCGVFHTGMLCKSGSVYMTGGNSFGQLGLGNKKSQNRPERLASLEGVLVKRIRCSNFSAAVSDKGQLYVWGSGIFGEYLVPHRWSLREPVVDVDLGAGYGVAIDNSGSVYVWGGNSNGELGLEDYDVRPTPTLVSSIKGKFIRKLACGSNFCIGLGSDINPKSKTPERKRRLDDNENLSNNGNNGNTGNTLSTGIGGISANNGKGRMEEVEKLSLEVKQTYRSYEELKRNFECLNEKYEVEKRNYGKLVEELNREISRYKQDIDRFRNQIELDDREIRELTGCVSDLRRSNHEAVMEANACREELSLYKRQFEDIRNVSRSELKKLDEVREKEILDLKEKVNLELNKRKHLEKELEKADHMIQEYENSIRTCQQDLNDLSREFEENSLKSEQERKRLSIQIEKYSKDLGDQFKKNEILLSDKEKLQSMMKSDLEKYFKENKELKFQIEHLEEQLEASNYENSEILKNLKSVACEKQDNENSLNNEIERINYEKQRKIESIMTDLEKLKHENLNLQRNNDYLNRKLNDQHAVALEVEKVGNENIQLNKKIEFLVLDNEKLSAGLSAEIELLSSQKSEIMEKYDKLYLDKERKVHSLGSEVDKCLQENNELRAKLENSVQENEKAKSQIQALKEDFRSLKSQTDQQSIENKRTQARMQESSFEHSGLLSKFQNLSKEKEDLVHRFSLVKKENEDLNSQYLHLSSEKDQLHSQYNQVSREKDQLSRTLSEAQARLCQTQKEKEEICVKLSSASKESQDLSSHLSSQVQEKDQLIRSLQSNLTSAESEIMSLKSELESNSCEIQELHMVIDHARQEKAQISSVLSDEISIKSSEMQKWVAQSNMKDKEIAFIKQILNDREAEVQRNQETLKSLLEENNLTKRQIEEMRHDKESLHLRMNEKEFLLNSIKESAGGWEYKYSECMKENDGLRAQVSDLEAKNRQLFDNLDRELAQRAKDYKERTMNILTQPVRAASPGLRPPTPDGRYYSRLQTPMMSVDRPNDDYSGNTAARLLSTLEASPKARSVVRTPTKEDLKAKIANLLENRSRIESELRGLDED